MTLLFIISELEQSDVGLADSGTGVARNRISDGYLNEQALALFGGKRYEDLWGDKGTCVIQVNA